MALYTFPGLAGHPNNNFANNPNSNFATITGNMVSPHVLEQIRAIIYDTADERFFDLGILFKQKPEFVPGDEFSYREMGYERYPIKATANVSGGATQTIPVSDVSAASIDILVGYPDLSRGTVTAIDAAAGTITVTAELGETLPAISDGDLLQNYSTVAADGVDYVSQYVRYNDIGRTNYIQLFAKAMRWGVIEEIKYKMGGGQLGRNFLQMNKKRMLQHYKAEVSNVFWMGRKAVVRLAGGLETKTTQGIVPNMIQAGSPFSSTIVANFDAALTDIVHATEFAEAGYTKFLYATPRLITRISKMYKGEGSLIRYEPNWGGTIMVPLQAIDFGSTKVVLVPHKRFEDTSSFPEKFRRTAFLIDHKNIISKFVIPEEMIELSNRKDGKSLRFYNDSIIVGSFGLENPNPLTNGMIEVADV